MKHWILFFSIFTCGTIFGDPQPLRLADVKSTMQELFSYHVEYKEFSPLLVKRSFKLYIEQFDTEKIYLLNSEIQPFLELSDKQIETIIKECQSSDFSEYLALNSVIQNAITRAREWRKEIEREMVLRAKDPEPDFDESYSTYATSENQLKNRIKKQLIYYLWSEKKKGDFSSWTPEQRAKVFALWEKRFERIENPYMIQKKNGALLSQEIGQHFLSLHILKAFSRSLDAHTDFFSPEEAFEMRTALEKEFEGIGVVLREGIDGVSIADFIKGGPAEKSGKILKGDMLVAIDGKPLDNASYEQVLDSMKGNGRKEITLGLKRFNKQGGEERVNVELKREKIVMQEERVHYTAEPCGDGIIGKLILPSFYESGESSSCEADMKEALRELRKKGNLLGLVLDMRENSGGFLNQAVKVAGLFITSGVIVISKYSQGEVQYLRDVDGRVYYNGPLVILTSKASASAAEIVAQALQDYGTAIVVGDERTYGKGTIQYQTVTDDAAKSFFKVTVGRYYTVSGRSTQIDGVKADIVVPTPYSQYHIGERYLEYPLSNDQVSSAYFDSLSDLDPTSKRWFQKNYLPNLQKKESFWVKMLPILNKNSQYRQKHDPNFQLFLKAVHQIKEENVSPGKNWGLEDLQMGQAVKILKDMIYQKTTQGKKVSTTER